jgi:predicted nucleic acid-binding protein
LLDSWAWIEYVKGSKAGNKVQEYVESNEEILISTINIAEIYRKLLHDTPQEADRIINLILNRSFTIFLDIETALNAAKIKYEKKFGMADAIVLATARSHSATIITGDNDFKGLENVKMIS